MFLPPPNKATGWQLSLEHKRLWGTLQILNYKSTSQLQTNLPEGKTSRHRKEAKGSRDSERLEVSKLKSILLQGILLEKGRTHRKKILCF